MLLEARRRGERLAAVGAGVGPSPDVLRADVPLQVAGVREHLLRLWGGGRGQGQGEQHTHREVGGATGERGGRGV